MSDWINVASIHDLEEGSRLLFENDEMAVILFRVNNKYYAVDNMCSHDDAELIDGELDGCELECPLHGALFDITNGEALCAPAYEPIMIYETRIVDDTIQLRL